jgi:hypothetical protein
VAFLSLKEAFPSQRFSVMHCLTGRSISLFTVTQATLVLQLYYVKTTLKVAVLLCSLVVSFLVQKKVSVKQKECLAVVHCVRKFLHNVEYSSFVIETDNAALKNMQTMDEPPGRVRRWSMRLICLNCSIYHRRCKQNLVADALSRSPVESNLVELLERLVDDLLPMEDSPFEPRLTFAAEEEFPPEHMCNRCTKSHY